MVSWGVHLDKNKETQNTLILLILNYIIFPNHLNGTYISNYRETWGLGGGTLAQFPANLRQRDTSAPPGSPQALWLRSQDSRHLLPQTHP